jgi:hypothetical protein
MCERLMKKNYLSMRYTTIVIIAIAAAGLFASSITPALAANPHFTSASAARSGNALVCSFKEAGLGNRVTVDITCSATANTQYSCVNNGGKIPKDAKKTTISQEVSESGTFTSGDNGQVTGTLTIQAPPSPPPSSVLSCPSGQQATLIGVTYTNVKVIDTTNGASRNIPGTF